MSEGLQGEMREHLEGLPFWKGLRDSEYGGFYGWVDSDKRVDKKAVKGCILNSRILWFFSNAWAALGDESLREYADHAFAFLKDHCYDRERGGVYWSVTYDGKPEDTTKHTYNQAFAVYALSSYYAVSGSREALELALALRETIETRCFDEGGYKEALDIAFEPAENDKLSENGVMADRTMNTLLHVFEAYTELYRVTKDETAGRKLRWMMDLIAEKIYNPARHRQEVFFDNDMNSLIDLHSYGHDIETAWLVDRGTDVLGDEAYKAKMAPITADLEQNVYETAYSAHSLKNECERGVDNEDRIWWVQAEAVVGFYNAWSKHPEKTYFRDAALDIWGFIKAHLVDPAPGSEWFWRTDAQGRPDLDKPIVEPWKCPYHNGRMCMEIMRRGREIPSSPSRAERSGMEVKMIHPKYYEELARQEALLARKNEKDESFYNGLFDRYQYPVLTREHTPLHWRYDLNAETNPHFMERLGVNAVMNSGAIWLDGKFYLVARVEGNDRKSFFAVAESESGVDGFRFWDYPILLEDTCPEETNVYDMRLTKHEDGYIYGVFCSESKDNSVSDLSAAVAAAGIVRTRDLKTWERLPNLKTLNSPQQRNVVLHPEFVDGKYAFYTRPMDDFIDTGSGGGIGFGLCEDITHPVIDQEIITSRRKYHTLTEVKNGAGAVPIKTDRGWIHIAHGVRNTAAGLRYVIYAFATALEDPSRVIAEPSGLLIGPRGWERVGDVSNVVFTNGAVALDNGEVYIYYAASDTRMHVATTTLEKLTDYVFNTPEDPLRSVECVAQRCALIDRNLALLREEGQREKA